MKILNESSIISEDEISEFNKLKNNNDRVNFIRSKLLNNPQIKMNLVDTPNKDTNLMADLTISIVDKGWDPEDNKYLDIVTSLTETLPAEGVSLASKILELSKSHAYQNDWMTKANSYKPLYKAKALAFLNSDKAKSFGDNPQRAIKDITPMTSEDDIKSYLSSWQTRNGEAREELLSILGHFLKEAPTLFKGEEDSQKKLRSVKDPEGLNNKEGKALLRKILTTLDKNNNYSEIIQKLTESLLKEARGDKEWWEDKYQDLLDTLGYSSKSFDKAGERVLRFLRLTQELLDLDKNSQNLLIQSQNVLNNTFKLLAIMIKELNQKIDNLNNNGGKKTISNNSSTSRKTGLKLLADYLREELNINSVDNLDAVEELKKIIRKSSLYRNLSNNAGVEDYLDDNTNLRKVLARRFSSWDSMFNIIWKEANQGSED